MQNFLFNLGVGGKNSSTGTSQSQSSQQLNAGTETAEEQQQHQMTDQQKLMAQLQMQNQATLLEGLSQPGYLAQLSMLQHQQQHQAAVAAQAMAENSLAGLHQSSASHQQHQLRLVGAAHALSGFDDSTANTLAGLRRNAHLFHGNPLAGAGLGSSYADSNRLLLRQLLQANSNAAAPSPLSSPWSTGMGAGSGLHPSISSPGDLYADRGMLGPWSATSAGVLDKIAKLDREEASTKKKVVRRKPKDRPKRPLSAYNIFFKEERARILSEIPGEEAEADEEDTSGSDKTPAGSKRKKSPHGKIGFESLAKAIGRRWKSLEGERSAYYKSKAAEDMGRYKKEMEVFLAKQAEKKKAEEQSAEADKSEEDGTTKGGETAEEDEETSEPQSKRLKVAGAESSK